MARIIFSLYALVTLAAAQATYAIEFNVANKVTMTPGGIRFRKEIGIEYSTQTLASAMSFILELFQQNNKADTKDIQHVSLFIEAIDGVAFAVNNDIHVSANYLQVYPGDVKREITGILYHEMTHIVLWNGNEEVPGGLIEGIADFVRLKAGYAPSHWVQPGEGDRWDQGYDVTAQFLDYCNSLRNGFVAELTKRMRSGYNGNHFVELLGKTVDKLWRDYKARYNL